jgi:hypothetical protein
MRFNDTMSDARTLIQTQYEEVRSGINARGEVRVCDSTEAVAAGTTKCLLIGKVIQFVAGSSDVSVKYVVAWEDPTLGAEGTLTDEIAWGRANLTVLNDASAETAKILWGSTYVKGFNLNNGDGFSTLAILHSLVSSAVLVYAGGDDMINRGGTGLDVSKGKINVPLAFVVKNADRGFWGGAICIDPGSTSSNVRVAVPVNESGVTKEGLKIQCAQ